MKKFLKYFWICFTYLFKAIFLFIITDIAFNPNNIYQLVSILLFTAITSKLTMSEQPDKETS